MNDECEPEWDVDDVIILLEELEDSLNDECRNIIVKHNWLVDADNYLHSKTDVGEENSVTILAEKKDNDKIEVKIKYGHDYEDYEVFLEEKRELQTWREVGNFMEEMFEKIQEIC